MFTCKRFVLVCAWLSILVAAGFSQNLDWKPYSSSLGGFGVRYPADWHVREDGYYGLWRATFDSPGVRDEDVTMSAGIQVCSQPRGYVSVPTNSQSRCGLREQLNGIYKDRVVSETTVELSGLKIHKTVSTARPDSNVEYINAAFSTKDRDYLVSGVFPRTFNLEKYIPVFDQMLASLNVSEVEALVTFRESKYDFSLTYPNSWTSCSVSQVPNADEEELLKLVPKGRSCSDGTFLSVSRMTTLSLEKNNRDLKGFLKGKDYTKISPYIEFGNIHAAMGESSNGEFIRRERFFYTNYPTTYELLRISESYRKDDAIVQREAAEILATARRFLKVQG